MFAGRQAGRQTGRQVCRQACMHAREDGQDGTASKRSGSLLTCSSCLVLGRFYHLRVRRSFARYMEAGRSRSPVRANDANPNRRRPTWFNHCPVFNVDYRIGRDGHLVQYTGTQYRKVKCGVCCDFLTRGKLQRAPLETHNGKPSKRWVREPIPVLAPYPGQKWFLQHVACCTVRTLEEFSEASDYETEYETLSDLD